MQRCATRCDVAGCSCQTEEDTDLEQVPFFLRVLFFFSKPGFTDLLFPRGRAGGPRDRVDADVGAPAVPVRRRGAPAAADADVQQPRVGGAAHGRLSVLLSFFRREDRHWTSIPSMCTETIPQYQL